MAVSLLNRLFAEYLIFRNFQTILFVKVMVKNVVKSINPAAKGRDVP